MDGEKLKNILGDHWKWLNDNGGKCADLRSADLRDADLRGADLWGADLRGADLRGANLQRANLRDAYLQGAYLQGAYLRGAYLQGANLQHADLRDAYLQVAYLRGAYLRGANLQGADLQGADLPHYQIPQHGELRVYKKVDGKIVHLLIPSWAKRTASLVGRKCRASAAKVLAIQDDKPVIAETHGPSTTYTIGEYVYPDSYDPDPRVECSHGIHFFLTRKEAEEWR
jgi:hypothetical protein